MAVSRADRAKTIALEWGGNTHVFSAGRFTILGQEDREDFQHSDGVHDFQFNWIDLVFVIYLGYLDQQLNAGVAYTLADMTQIAAAPAVGVIDVLNILKESNITTVQYYPKLEDNLDVVDLTKYRVLSLNNQTALMQAEQAGRFQPFVPVRMIVKTPLNDYPAFANR